MIYTTTSEPYMESEVDVDYWLCLYCGNEVITADQIRINDERLQKVVHAPYPTGLKESRYSDDSERTD